MLDYSDLSEIKIAKDELLISMSYWLNKVSIYVITVYLQDRINIVKNLFGKDPNNQTYKYLNSFKIKISIRTITLI